MSTSLVRKGLEIVDPDCFATGKSSNNKNTKLSHKKGKKSQQVTTHLFGGKVKSGKNSKAGSQSLETIRKRLQVDVDNTDENIRRLQLLSSTSVDQVTANKILVRAGKVKTDIVQEKQKDEKTVFTEEDFEAFEKEYFVS